MSSDSSLKRRLRCSVLACENHGGRDPKTGKQRVLFCFPVADKKRCLQWMINAGLRDEVAKPYKTPFHYICPDHFEDSMFKNRKWRDKLTNDAVPTIFCKLLGV